MAGVSDYRRKKLTHVFNIIFDINKSGTIEQKDFELAVENINKMRGWTTDDPRSKATRETLFLVWEKLKTRADRDKDEIVTLEEWLKMWNEAQAEGKAPEWQVKYLDFIFELVDTSCDGNIDEDEFVKVYRHYGVSDDEAKQAFAKFSQNNTVNISKDVFVKLWDEYFLSDDPNLAGNYIFGKTSF